MTELASATFVEIVSTDGAAAFLKANPIPITSQLAELKASAAASSPLSEGSVALGLIGQWQGFALFASSDVLAAVDAKEKAALLDLALGLALGLALRLALGMATLGLALGLATWVCINIQEIAAG